MEVFKKVKPYHQAVISLALGIFFMLTCISFEDTIKLRPEKPWVFATTFLMFYSVVNSVFSLSAENAEKYWRQSILCFIGLVFALGGLAYLISGLGINEAGSFKWIFTVVTIAYGFFMLIVQAMKFIVDFAQKEEWNQPRKK